VSISRTDQRNMRRRSGRILVLGGSVPVRSARDPLALLQMLDVLLGDDLTTTRSAGFPYGSICPLERRVASLLRHLVDDGRALGLVDRWHLIRLVGGILDGVWVYLKGFKVLRSVLVQRRGGLLINIRVLVHAIVHRLSQVQSAPGEPRAVLVSAGHPLPRGRVLRDLIQRLLLLLFLRKEAFILN